MKQPTREALEYISLSCGRGIVVEFDRIIVCDQVHIETPLVFLVAERGRRDFSVPFRPVAVAHCQRHITA
jgi:hypothetical protein